MAAKNVTAFVKFVIAREAVRRIRVSGAPKPWTNDPILQRYRFCNIHRDDDTVTQWIHAHMLEPFREQPDLWFAMAVARFVNWPDTLSELMGAGALFMTADNVLRWSPTCFKMVMRDRAKRGDKVFTGAYMVKGGARGTDKAGYLADDVLSPAWARREYIRPKYGEAGMFCTAVRMMELKNFGGFMVGQIIADTKHASPLRDMYDRDSWAVSGPGSRRGLARVFGYPLDEYDGEDWWGAHLYRLREQVAQPLSKAKIFLDAQDLQNCLCEFDKYERVRLGEGRPRSTYPGV